MDDDLFPDARRLVTKYLRLLDDGEDISKAQVLQHFAKVLNDLKDEFGKLEELDQVLLHQATPAPQEKDSTRDSRSQGHTKRSIVRCPNCQEQNTIEGLTDSINLFFCKNCNQEFSLISDRKWPDFIAHFELIEQIGRGGFGVVWKAKDSQLDRYVALKLPRHRHFESAEAEKFLQEAQTAAKLQHPNIVRVLEVGTFLDEVFIVSELIDGQPLSQKLIQGLPESEVLEISIPLAQALDYAHSQRVVHRDLKPHNVILDSTGRPFLSDFGLAGHLSTDATMTMGVDGQSCGTPRYMSPEQARGERGDELSDVYSFGVLLYEMLTGQVPFHGSFSDIVRRLETEEPIHPQRLNARISTDLDTVCMKCLEKSPSQRYTTFEEVASELQRVEAKRPIQARPIGPPQRALRWARRNPSVAGWSGLAVLALLVTTLVTGNYLSQQKLMMAIERVNTRGEIRRITDQKSFGHREEITKIIAKNQQMLKHSDFMGFAKQSYVDAMGDYSGFSPTLCKASGDELFLATAVSFDGSTVAVASDKLRIRLNEPDWPVVWQSPKYQQDKTNEMIAVSFTGPRSSTLLAITMDGILHRITKLQDTWRHKEDVVLAHRLYSSVERPDSLPQVLCARFTSDGSRLAFATSEHIAVFDLNDFSIVWQCPTSQLNLGVKIPKSVAISAEGHLVMAYADATGTSSGWIGWDITNKSAARVKHETTGQIYRFGVDVSRDGQRVICGGNTATLFDLTKSPTKKEVLVASGSEVKAVAISPSAEMVAVVDSAERVDIFEKPLHPNGARYHFDMFTSGSTGLNSIQFSNDLKSLFCSHTLAFHLVRLECNEERLVLPSHADRGVPDLRFTCDGTKLLSSGGNGTVHISDTRTGDMLSRCDEFGGNKVQSITLNSNERWLATAAWDEQGESQGTKIRIWSFPNFEPMSVVETKLRDVCAIQASPCGRYLAAIGKQGFAVWSIKDGEDQPKFALHFEDMTVTKGVFLLFDRSGDYLYYVNNWGYLRCLDVSNKESYAFQNEEEPVICDGWNSLTLMPDGRVAFVHEKHKAVYHWSFPRRQHAVISHPQQFWSAMVAINAKGRVAGLVKSDTVGIWDINRESIDDRFLYHLPAEKPAFIKLRGLQIPNRLAVSDSKGSVVIWNLDTVERNLVSLGMKP